MEQITNTAQTTLATGINASVTSLSIVSATGFPSSGNFRLLIGTEILLVTARSGTTLTVTRGQEGSTAASHTAGVPVTIIFTAGALQAILDDLPKGGFSAEVDVPSGTHLVATTDEYIRVGAAGTVQMPSSGVSKMRTTIRFLAAGATLDGNGHNVENPLALGTYASTFVAPTPGAFVFTWDTANTRWENAG